MTAGLDPPRDPWPPTRLAVLAAASAGDAAAVFHLASDLLGEGVPFPTILFEVMAPLEAQVGDRWYHGDFTVADEHLVTSTLETVVALLTGSFDVPDEARKVVVACAEGDAHSLPARMIAAHLVYLGWRAVFLGSGQPAADLGAFLSSSPPAALILSCAIAGALPGARASIREAHRAGVPVLVGGQAFGPGGRRAYALGADAWTADPEAVDEILRTWQPDPAAAEAAATDGGDDLTRLGERRADLVARVVSLVGPVSPTGRGRVLDDLQLLLDTLASSLLLGDSEVICQLASWLRSERAEVPGERLLAALREAVGEDPPRAASFLAVAAG